MVKWLSYRHRVLLIGLIWLLDSSTSDLFAQRISFGVFAGDGITIDSPQGINPGLDFNRRSRIITSNNEPVAIGLADSEPYVVYRIQAPEGFDLLIDVDQPTELWLDGNSSSEHSIPLTLRIAYNNLGAVNEFEANKNVVEAPLGMNSLIVPVSRSTGQAPGPPPNPLDGEQPLRNKSTLYLFLYGTLGPIQDVQAGIYSAEININVSYASY